MLEKIKEGLLPIIASFECHLDSMEYVKEKGEWYLRVFIEKNDGNVHIDLKNPQSGIDSLEGTLASIDGKELLIQYMVKAVRKKMTINYDDIKFIRLAVKF